MNIEQKITTKDEARQYAIDWQNWVAETGSISYGELAEWGAKFTLLGREFDLLEEFEENGIC